MLTKTQAIKLAESGFWKEMSADEIVRFQLFEALLCMPFDTFHQAIEKALGRPVWTHEFAFMDGLRKEFLKEKQPPTLDEVIALIPVDKRVLVVA